MTAFLVRLASQHLWCLPLAKKPPLEQEYPSMIAFTQPRRKSQLGEHGRTRKTWNVHSEDVCLSGLWPALLEAFLDV